MGKISPYLIQPLNPFFRYFAQHLAEQITRFPFALVIAFFFFIFNPDSLWVPNMGSLFLGTISTFLSFLIQFLIQSTIACLCLLLFLTLLKFAGCSSFVCPVIKLQGLIFAESGDENFDTETCI